MSNKRDIIKVGAVRSPHRDAIDVRIIRYSWPDGEGTFGKNELLILDADGRWYWQEFAPYAELPTTDGLSLPYSRLLDEDGVYERVSETVREALEAALPIVEFRS